MRAWFCAPGLIAKGIKMKAKFTIPYMIGGIMIMNILGTLRNTHAAEAQGEFYKIDSIPARDIKARPISPDTSLAETEWVDLMPQAVRAMERRKDVLYVMNTGDTICRRGGTRAWRNMNPGCLRYADFAKDNGAIGKCGGFAVFPDEQTGRAALIALLRSDTYNKLSIARAIAKYAPPHENNVSLYRTKLRKMTGLPLDKKLARLDSAEIEKVANAICQIEGWREGSIEQVGGQNTLLAAMRERQMQDSMQRAL